MRCGPPCSLISSARALSSSLVIIGKMLAAGWILLPAMILIVVRRMTQRLQQLRRISHQVGFGTRMCSVAFMAIENDDPT